MNIGKMESEIQRQRDLIRSPGEYGTGFIPPDPIGIDMREWDELGFTNVDDYREYKREQVDERSNQLSWRPNYSDRDDLNIPSEIPVEWNVKGDSQEKWGSANPFSGSLVGPGGIQDSESFVYNPETFTRDDFRGTHPRHRSSKRHEGRRKFDDLWKEKRKEKEHFAMTERGVGRVGPGGTSPIHRSQSGDSILNRLSSKQLPTDFNGRGILDVRSEDVSTPVLGSERQRQKGSEVLRRVGVPAAKTIPSVRTIRS